MEAMPLSRLASRLIAEEKRFKEEEERRAQDMVAQSYIIARVLRSALIVNQPIPPTSKQEENAPVNYADRKKYKRFREKHDPAFDESLQGLQHHGKWFGMPKAWGEPPDEEQGIQTAREIKEREREELKQGWGNFVEAFSESMDRLSEQTGNASIF